MADATSERVAAVARSGAGLRSASNLEDALLGIGLPHAVARLYRERRTYSETRLEELARRLARSDKLSEFPNLVVYAAGSYARGEASEFSDIDLFFVHDDVGTEPVDDPNLKGLRAISAVIREMEEGMEFPPPSNDGQFLNIIKLSEILKHLGGAEDDYRNNFTARMLLLLESRSVYGSSSYEKIKEKVIEAYLRDYEDHPADFHPTFLANDAIRFWKTLCLNYEHRRNQAEEARKIKQKIKNLKLKFSRMSTCFATVSLLSNYDHIEPGDILEITKLSPLERLVSLSRRAPATTPQLKAALELYAWFLKKTALSAEDLRSYFEDKANRVDAFSRADEFGARVFDIVKTSAEERGNLRYLVV